MNTNLNKIAQKIKLLILDCDGVLTDGKIYVTANGEETIAFYVQDGYGIQRLQSIGIMIAVISGRKNNAVEYRLKQLKIEHVFLGQDEKITALNTLIQTLKIPLEQIAYIGDDLPDIDIMQKVALPIAVANAIEPVKKIAKICTQKKGGKGAVREVCDFIYSSVSVSGSDQWE